MQGLDVTSGELVNGARKECENPLTYQTMSQWQLAKLLSFMTEQVHDNGVT